MTREAFEKWWDTQANTPAPDTYKRWEESCRQAWQAATAAAIQKGYVLNMMQRAALRIKHSPSPVFTAEALAARVAQMQDELSRLDVLLEECKMGWSGDVAQLKAEHAHELAARVAQARAEQREKDAVISEQYPHGHELKVHIARAIRAQGKQTKEIGFNGLTEEETNQTMSVRGLT